MSSLLKSIGDNEKVMYTDGKITLLEQPSEELTFTLGLIGLVLVGTGGSFCVEMWSLPRPMVPCLMGTIIMLLGAVAIAEALNRQHSSDSKEAFIVLDSDGICVRGVPKLSWKDVEKFNVDSSRRYDLDGFLSSAVREIYLTDKQRKPLFAYRQTGNSFPISFDHFVDILEYYWNKNKISIV